MANNSLKEIVKKVLERLTNTRLDTLLNVASGLSTTTYTLSDNLANYDFIIVTAYSSYSNRWQTAIPVGVFTSSASQTYYLSLGTEYSTYYLALRYVSGTQISVNAKGTAVIGINIAGVKLGGGYCLNAVISRLSAILHRSCQGVM